MKEIEQDLLRQLKAIKRQIEGALAHLADKTEPCRIHCALIDMLHAQDKINQTARYFISEDKRRVR